MIDGLLTNFFRIDDCTTDNPSFIIIYDHLKTLKIMDIMVDFARSAGVPLSDR
jgi:hypothetical protein